MGISLRPARLWFVPLSVACAAVASAQGMHPMPLGPTPFHLRLAEADAVAIGTVSAIHDGRIEVRDALVLRGELGESFEIKRAPSKPPPLAVGLQAVFLLRGARAPYVMVDGPKELVVLRDAASARAWRDALPPLLGALGDPERLLALYVAWLDGSDESLRATAAAALVDARSKLPPLAADAALERARVALDAARAIEVRRVSAHLAGTHAAGAAALLRGLPNAAPDPQILETALRAGALMQSTELAPTLDRAFANDDIDLRRRALRIAVAAWSDPVAAEVRALSERDPDPALRQEAKEALDQHEGAR